MKTQTTEKVNNDLETFLSQYSNPMEIAKGEQSETVSNSPAIEPVLNSPAENPVNENWQGNPAYYQSGKKAGKLKPQRANKQNAQQSQPTGDPIQYNDIITGALLITLIDVLIPLLIAGINNLASKNKIDSNLLTLNSSQKKSLEPVAEEAAKRISLQGNPVVILMVTLVGIYGMNFFMVKQLSSTK